MKKTGKKLFSVIMAVLVVLTTTVSAFALTVNECSWHSEEKSQVI